MESNFKIGLQLGVLANENNGWTKELNFVSWNGREPVYDIRTWSDNHQKAGKGVTLTISEAIRLRDLLNRLNLVSNDGFVEQ